MEKIENRAKEILSLDNITKEMYQKLIERIEFDKEKNIFISINEEFIWPSLNNKFTRDKGTCLGLKTHIAILSNDYYIKENFTLENSNTNYYKSLYKTDFLNNMLNDIIKNKEVLNDLLEKEIRNYNNTIENLLDTTRECFILAMYEMQNFSEVPTEVIINEYVDIVAEFTNDENETKFANRVLDNLAVKLRNKQEEKKSK